MLDGPCALHTNAFLVSRSELFATLVPERTRKKPKCASLPAIPMAVLMKINNGSKSHLARRRAEKDSRRGADLTRARNTTISPTKSHTRNASFPTLPLVRGINGVLVKNAVLTANRALADGLAVDMEPSLPILKVLSTKAERAISRPVPTGTSGSTLRAHATDARTDTEHEHALVRMQLLESLAKDLLTKSCLATTKMLAHQ